MYRLTYCTLRLFSTTVQKLHNTIVLFADEVSAINVLTTTVWILELMILELWIISLLSRDIIISLALDFPWFYLFTKHVAKILDIQRPGSSYPISPKAKPIISQREIKKLCGVQARVKRPAKWARGEKERAGAGQGVWTFVSQYRCRPLSRGWLF